MGQPVLTISVRYLQPYFHGRGEDGLPEWPPSPLRLFQALVSSGVGAARDDDGRRRAADALRWLERLPPPTIVAPAAVPVEGYRTFVPDNVGDRVARSWAAGRAGDLAGYRTEKDVRPLRLRAADHAVHYVFDEATQIDDHFAAIQRAARGVTHLGWGIDQVAGDATTNALTLRGERWIPGRRGHGALRCAIDGTLKDLEEKHMAFLRRVDGELFRPVPPLAAFTMLPYARTTDQELRPMAAFRLLDPVSGHRLWLDPRRRARDVAAWLRHAVDDVSRGWPFGPTDMVVHGHAEAVAVGHADVGPRSRFSYLPLPTITPRGTEAIARALIVGAPGLEAELDWIRGGLAGLEVSWRGRPQVMLEPLPIAEPGRPGDAVLGHYLGEASEWSTVTPVVLPGHDDGSSLKAERLLRKAFLQAGMAVEVVDGIRELEWRDVGYRAGVDRARAYLPPDKVTGPMFHVRVLFGAAIRGPLAIGSGRHRGLGVFAVSER